MTPLALACACQPVADKLTSVFKLVGLFMLVPFLITAFVIWMVRQAAHAAP